MVRNQYDLVYGGASIGLMGAVADAVIEAKGSVIGVMPKSLSDKEIAHTGLNELHIATSMHERKSIMADLSDAFVAIPGGLGTLEELFEMWTWAQLGFHHKPVAILNYYHYFDKLVQFLDHATEHGFVKKAHRSMLIESTDANDLFQQLNAYQPTLVDKLP
jgi:uncharacterized protein (TIGR00730 family)